MKAKRIRRKIKNTVLRIFVMLNVFSFFTMIAAIECFEPKIPCIVLSINALFLCLMGWANDWFEGEGDCYE